MKRFIELGYVPGSLNRSLEDKAYAAFDSSSSEGSIAPVTAEDPHKAYSL